MTKLLDILVFKKKKDLSFRGRLSFHVEISRQGRGKKEKKKGEKVMEENTKNESTRGGHPVAHTRERSRERVSTISVAENSKRISVPRIEGYNRDRI